MDSRILGDRLRGGIAAFFLIRGLHGASRDLFGLAFYGTHIARIGNEPVGLIGSIPFVAVPLILQVFLAGWLFFNKKFASMLALAFTILLVLQSVIALLASFTLQISTTGVSFLGPTQSSTAFLCSSMLIVIPYSVILLLVLRLRQLER